MHIQRKVPKASDGGVKPDDELNRPPKNNEGKNGNKYQKAPLPMFTCPEMVFYQSQKMKDKVDLDWIRTQNMESLNNCHQSILLNALKRLN